MLVGVGLSKSEDGRALFADHQETLDLLVNIAASDTIQVSLEDLAVPFPNKPQCFDMGSAFPLPPHPTHSEKHNKDVAQCTKSSLRGVFLIAAS